MYENILVGYDGSEYSRAALKEAASWVKRHGGKIALVHGVYFDEEEFGIAPVQLEKRLEVGKKVCFQAKETASSEFGVELDSLVCEGDPPAVILDVAKGKNADLIALGTHGRRGIRRLLMGSVTSHVILDATCDVLVVKRPCGDCAGRFGKVLVPFDGSEFSKKALAKACQLAKEDGSEVRVLYVIPRYEEMMNFMRTASIKESMLNEAGKVTAVAVELAKGLGVTVEVDIEEGHAADKVAEVALKHKCDLVVIGSHGWRGFDKAIMGSVAERVITTSPCPVLVAR